MLIVHRGPEEDVYRYLNWYGFMLLGLLLPIPSFGTFQLLVSPFPHPFGENGETGGFVICLCLAVVGWFSSFCLLMFTLRASVTLVGNEIRCTDLLGRVKIYHGEDIIDFREPSQYSGEGRLYTAPQATSLLVKFRTGEKILIYGSINDYQQLKRRIMSLPSHEDKDRYVSATGRPGF